jgi:hypothetical protein
MKMKVGFILSLILMLVIPTAFAQFNMKNPEENFTLSGRGMETDLYYFRVPASVTIEDAKTGKSWKGGEVIGVPGHYIDLLTQPQVEMAMKNNVSFNAKSDVPPAPKWPDTLMLELMVPAGFTIKNTDGRTVTGPSSIMLIVSAESMKKVPMGKRMEGYYEAGFQQK